MEANQMVEENSEKLTINISVVDLGKIDYLVDQGYYANRTDFLRTAIKGLLRSHEDWLNREFMTKTLDIGIVRLCSEDIKGKEHQDYTVLGMLIIDESVTLDDLKKAFRRIRVFGKVKCSSAIKEAYSL
jgi:Arc/MetJ-type ribon-helix-helix transcriptional regulator